MEKKSLPARIVLYESLGFLAIIVVCLFDELVGLSSLILGNQSYISDFRETILKMLLILAVWLLVATSTRRVLDRVRQLEGFMKVCAWCRRIDFNGRWVPLEQYFKEGFDTPTTHGICEECLEAQKAALRRARGKKPEHGTSA